MKKQNLINVNLAVKEAFSGFKTFWLALCLLSTAILLSQSWLPHFLFSNIIDQRKFQKISSSLSAVKEKFISTADPDAAITQLKVSLFNIYNDPATSDYINLLMLNIILILFITAIILCFLYITIIILSKNNSSNANAKTEIKINFRKSHILSLSYFILCIIKALFFLVPFLIPVIYLYIKISAQSPSGSAEFHLIELFFVFSLTVFCFLLSIYIYIRLYFTGFIITEKSYNPITAITASYKMTYGNFKGLFSIFCLTVIIDIFSIVSVIGFIPGTGLKYTLRASAYRQCLENKGGKNE